MSKRSKKNHHAKLPLPPKPAKRGFPGTAFMLAAGAIVVALGFGWWKFNPADTFLLANAITSESSSEFQKLKGRWQRPDGGYVIEIKGIAENGAMDAAYSNPRSIHVAKAEASRDGDTVKVFIELRDVNYPGSTYSLIYDSVADQLRGIYYQAVERRRFEVTFMRMK